MSRSAQPLFGARSLAEWVLHDGGPSRTSYRQALRLKWHAFWFEHNWRASLKRLESARLPEDPVFILGLWRSGTTVLHELIAACADWTTPRTWQCFNPSTCFLTGPPARAAAVDRPMDRGRIETYGPQEDEFALLLLGEPSAYRGLIDPRRLIECGQRLWSGSEGSLSRWQDFLRGISSAGERQGQAAGDSRAAAPPRALGSSRQLGSDDSSGVTRLLLKSPNHSFRLPLIERLFPRAQFIWIGRHPGEVLASNSRMWGAMMSQYALWDCPAGVLEQFLRDAMRACATVLDRCLAEMAPERLLWVDYEMLQVDPARVLRRVLQFVGADTAHEEAVLRARIESALASVPIHRGRRAAMPDDEYVRRLDGLMRAARQRFATGLSDWHTLC